LEKKFATVGGLKGENSVHENCVIFQSLDEHALKNSVILELYDF
jgi:hypothetical protein